MKKTCLILISVLSVGLLIGCNSDDGGEYKVEGTPASSNPSVGEPVSAGGDPAPTDDGGTTASAGKEGAPRGRASKK